jgi:LacI family transcriptional regulator
MQKQIVQLVQSFAQKRYFCNMNITLKHIAKELHVSVSTVSRALKNHPRIGLETREKVQKLAQELDYEPNTIAIHLKSKQTKTLGVIVPQINLHFFSEILSGMDEMAHKIGYHLLICQSNENAEREKSQLIKLYKANVDGILVAVSKQTADYGAFNILRKKGFPILFFARIHTDFPAVLSNDVKGAEMATQHLIDQGCKKIAHIAGPWHLRSTSDRLNGYINTLQKHKIPVVNEYIVYSEMERENNIEAIYKLLNTHTMPDGIFCFNDYVAYDIIQVLKQKKIDVGKDVLVVGYANEPIALHMEPSLTSIDQQAYQIGQQSVREMVRLIEYKNEKSPISYLETKLFVRNSSRNALF